MFFIKSIDIEGFWSSEKLSCNFNNDVNIIIGRNGSGKTTFLNILTSILTCDFKTILENQFSKATLFLVKGKQKRKIIVSITQKESISLIKYKISNKVYGVNFRLLSDNNSFRLKFGHDEVVNNLYEELSSLVSLSSLSVYRLRSEDEIQIYKKGKKQLVSPLDYKVLEVMQRLLEFQLEISEKIEKVSNKLKNDILISLLFDKPKILNLNEYNPVEEKEKLLRTYNKLNLGNINIEEKIDNHIDSINKFLMEVADSEEKKIDVPKAFSTMEAIRRTREVINMSLNAEDQKEQLMKPLNDFQELLKTFILDKNFIIKKKGGLEITNQFSNIVDITKLSSGEKQIIILLCEALLQRDTDNIYIADEPEISLHIQWQKDIIPAIRKLNPSCQMILATHSPEIASFNKNRIISMRNLFNG